MRYLILTYIKRPNGQIDEALEVAKRVKRSEWSTANVILDFKECKVLKATMDGTTVPKIWDRVVAYYYQHYQATIERLFQENGHAVEQPAEADPS